MDVPTNLWMYLGIGMQLLPRVLTAPRRASLLPLQGGFMSLAASAAPSKHFADGDRAGLFSDDESTPKVGGWAGRGAWLRGCGWCKRPAAGRKGRGAVCAWHWPCRRLLHLLPAKAASTARWC